MSVLQVFRGLLPRRFCGSAIAAATSAFAVGVLAVWQTQLPEVVVYGAEGEGKI